MKIEKREPRSIKDILLDIAEDTNDDYGKALRKLPCIPCIHYARARSTRGQRQRSGAWVARCPGSQAGS